MSANSQDTNFRIHDGFDYAHPDCYLVDSIEVFFDATTTAFLSNITGLMSTIDAVGPVPGYFSIRFCGQTNACLGMEQSKSNVSIEVSLLRGASNNEAVISAIETYTLANGGKLHWGQRCDQLNATNVVSTMYPRLATWEQVRWRLIHATGLPLHTFDNTFTTRCGL